MIIGRVSGNVVATRKHGKLEGRSLLTVEPTTLEGDPTGEELLALDTVGAGVGDLVLVVVEGRSTSQAIGVASAPANAAIVGIIDQIDIDANALEPRSKSDRARRAKRTSGRTGKAKKSNRE